MGVAHTLWITPVDNSPEWGPKPGAVILVAAAGALMAAAFVMLAGDIPGRFLTGLAAGGLLVFAAGSWRAGG